MPFISIVFGLLLIGVGGGAYHLSELPPADKITSLIPAAVGLLLVVCGAVALKPNLRKHAMHAAVLIGLLAFIAALVRLIPALINWNDDKKLAVGALAGMAVLCGAFVVLCVKSFIDARRARKQKELQA